MAYDHPDPLTLTFSRLAGRVIFVTGASSGIGRAAVGLFVAEGAKVAAAARRVDQLEALRGEHGDAVLPVECDVREEASVAAAVDATVAHFGRLDGAFNNAGVGGGRGPLHELDIGMLDRIMATNLRGVALCLKHEIAAMLQTGGGAIVNTSSIGGLVGSAGNSFYAASKWALAGLTRCAALDYARQKIRINAIAPGPTRSEMFDRWMPDEAAREGMADAMPMNYIAHPQDMARAALFLLSDEARWTTGIVLPCEGGASVD